MSDLDETRQRLADALEAEEASETQFTPLPPDYFEHSRRIAREAIGALDPSRAGDRERFQTAKELYDLASELSNARWSKVRRWAVAALDAGDPPALPENLLDYERVFLVDALQIGRTVGGEKR